MKKMADFIHTNLLKIPDALKNFLKKLHAVLKTLTMKYLRRLHADHKPLIEKYLVRLLFTHHRHCSSQRLKWILVRDHVNLVGSRNVLGYITTQGNNNIYHLLHSRLKEIWSIFFSEATNARVRVRVKGRVILSTDR